MLEPIQDNDNYKPHAKIIQIYPCLLSYRVNKKV